MYYRPKYSKNERGQALTELLVGILGILMLFLGFLLISSLGIDRVQNAVAARENAEQKSLNGVNSTGGIPIRYWDYGNDGLPFTNDDSAVNTMTDSTVFTRQLVGTIITHVGDVSDTTTAEEYLKSIQFSDMDQYTADLNVGTSSLSENFARDLGGNNIFLTAAGLSEGREVIQNSLERRKLSGLKSTMQTLFGVSDFQLIDTAYLPAQDPVDRGL